MKKRKVNKMKQRKSAQNIKYLKNFRIKRNRKLFVALAFVLLFGVIGTVALLQGWASTGLSWAPPSLTSPEKIYVTNASPYWLKTLDATKDYEIILPGRPGNPQTTPLNHGIGIVGGRNVVIIGGEIRVPSHTVQPDKEMRVGIKLRHQRGTIHIEGVKILNATDVINMQQNYGAIVQLQNIYGESSEYQSDEMHSDCLQTWAGPTELRVDRFTCITYYQGLFLNPDDSNFQNPAHPTPRKFDLRRININHVGEGGQGYVYHRIGSWPLSTLDIWGKHTLGKIVYSGSGSFPNVQTGIPPNGDFAPSAVAGMQYVSPGYGTIIDPPPANTGSVTLKGISHGETVSGLISVEAIPKDVSGSLKVDFYIDGTYYRSESTAPYCLSVQTGSTCDGSYDTQILSNGQHTLRTVMTYNNGANTAETTVTFNVNNDTSSTSTDTAPPSLPTNLHVEYSKGRFTLNWDASTDNVGVSGYYIYRNNERIATTTTTNYQDKNINRKSTYRYYIRAVDKAGNLSGASETVEGSW